MKKQLSRPYFKALFWLSGLAGLIVGFSVYSWVNPRFHSPFFGDAWGMAFVIAVYSLLYVTIGTRLQKWTEQKMHTLRGKFVRRIR